MFVKVLTHCDFLVVGVEEVGHLVHHVEREVCDAARMVHARPWQSAHGHVLVAHSLHLRRAAEERNVIESHHLTYIVPNIRYNPLDLRYW